MDAVHDARFVHYGSFVADIDSEPRTSMRTAFGHRSFRVLYAAETQSIIGDQLARLALSVLVFDRTHSTFASAATYAVTFLPAVLGGFVLGRLGDRYPRRRVMVGTDIVRALLFAVMAVPSMPLGVVIGVLAFAVFLGPAFSSAEVGYLAAALDRETFRAATAVRSASNQLAQVAGFAVGGVVVVTVDPRGALLVNAATFAVSALVITLGLAGARAAVARPELVVVKVDPAATVRRPRPRPGLGPEFPGLWRYDVTRVFMVLSAVTGLFVVPEGLAVPFGRAIDASTAQIGLLVATIPLGSAVGAVFVLTVPTRIRGNVVSCMAVGCGLPLLLSAAHPTWWVACVAWFASGVLAAYQVEATTVLVQAIPERRRSQLLGVIGAWLLGAQGAAFVLAGALATGPGPGGAIALVAGLGSVIASVVVFGPLRIVRRHVWAVSGA